MPISDLSHLFTRLHAYNVRLRDFRSNRYVNVFSDLFWSFRKGRKEGLKVAARTWAAMRYLRAQSAVDSLFYRLQIEAGPWKDLDAVTHYVLFGATEGLDPNANFSSAFYMGSHNDVASIGVNPLYHFLRYGSQEGRRTEPSQRVNELLRHLLGDTALIDDIEKKGGSPEECGAHRWYGRAGQIVEAQDRYEIRPDDCVLAEGNAGEDFRERFGFDTSSPRFFDAANSISEGMSCRDAGGGGVDVSIIIPVYGQLTHTLNCLSSVLSHKSRYRFEVIVADDASPDETQRVMRDVKGIRYVRYPTNKGFIENCNKTARLAEGRILVFLNNDTRVCEGWLDGLIDSFELFPNAGLVGSKLFYPDGTLQEAGGIVWRDGSAWNYGRNDDPNRPRYCYALDVDYVSGASIAISRQLWEALGGFDDYYRPAYYEDTDLAFRVRAAGKRVILQPASRVVHYEGKSSGTDTSTGIKTYQIVNQKKFFTRWRETLKTHRAMGDQPWAERDRGINRRVLILDSVNPSPGEDAGSLATVNLIMMFQSLGYKVTFAPEDNFLYEREKVQPLQAMGVECLYAPYETSLRSHLARMGDFYDVVQLIRPDVAFRNLEIVRSLAQRARVLFLNADLHSLRLSRQADVENKDYLRLEAKAYLDKEIHLARHCDAMLVHSSVERDQITKLIPDAYVEVIPLIERVVRTERNYSHRTDVMFLGGYNHPPNVDAANWLIDEIWPSISKSLPQARLLIVGSNPPEALKRRATDRILVTGTVPSLTPWFERAKVFVAPLRYGAGAKGKILASLAHGVPVVATSIGAEGMPLVNGKSFFKADRVDKIAASVLELYRTSESDWLSLSGLARDYVEAHHSFENGSSVLAKVLRNLRN